MLACGLPNFVFSLFISYVNICSLISYCTLASFDAEGDSINPIVTCSPQPSFIAITHHSHSKHCQQSGKWRMDKESVSAVHPPQSVVKWLTWLWWFHEIYHLLADQIAVDWLWPRIWATLQSNTHIERDGWYNTVWLGLRTVLVVTYILLINP